MEKLRNRTRYGLRSVAGICERWLPGWVQRVFVKQLYERKILVAPAADTTGLERPDWRR